MHDIAIIGTGPAGATLARLVADKYSVLLVDKRQVGAVRGRDSRGKCCGGLLAPDAQGMLSEMGLGLPREILVDPQLFVVRAIDVRHRIERYYQRYYINMDRGRFEGWLLSMIPAAVDIRLGCRFESYERDGRAFKIKLNINGQVVTERARILVGADGALSPVRKQALPDCPFPRAYFAIQEWVEADTQLPYFSSIFDPEISDYYCWTIPKGQHLLIGAALNPRDNTAGRFELLKSRLRDCGIGFGRTCHREGAFILRPVEGRQIATGSDGVVLVGEAAGWISPSSAEGFSYAFRSALILAEVLRATEEGYDRLYYRRTTGLRRNIFLKNVKSRLIYGPTLRTVVMKSGFRSMSIYRP
ncbi:MAG: FAD-binding protein [Planctomycetota bacterium]